MNVSQVLDGAADYIERVGWFGNTGGEINAGRACALIALVEVGTAGCEAVGTFATAIGWHGNRSGRGLYIARWNNDPARTKNEVLAMFRACAATERARAARLLPVMRETETQT